MCTNDSTQHNYFVSVVCISLPSIKFSVAQLCAHDVFNKNCIVQNCPSHLYLARYLTSCVYSPN